MSQGWQDIQAEALRRIQAREWPPGAQIPKEEALAKELGVARATVNRALRALAEDGWLERRRRAGTRVALSPQRRAQMSVPIVRQEVEDAGKTYDYKLLHEDQRGPELWLHALHLADGRPYALEDRVIHLDVVPQAAEADFTEVSANEWLVQNAPFERGTLEYSAEAAGSFERTYLACPPDMPLMILTRETFAEAGQITRVRTAFAPGRSLKLNI
ncbi:MAG: GntR family transcriptional regulator [Pseudomonadota bacterium]